MDSEEDTWPEMDVTVASDGIMAVNNTHDNRTRTVQVPQGDTRFVEGGC